MWLGLVHLYCCSVLLGGLFFFKQATYISKYIAYVNIIRFF
jgi:hypothetical protein